MEMFDLDATNLVSAVLLPLVLFTEACVEIKLVLRQEVN